MKNRLITIFGAICVSISLTACGNSLESIKVSSTASDSGESDISAQQSAMPTMSLAADFGWDSYDDEEEPEIDDPPEIDEEAAKRDVNESYDDFVKNYDFSHIKMTTVEDGYELIIKIFNDNMEFEVNSSDSGSIKLIVLSDGAKYLSSDGTDSSEKYKIDGDLEERGQETSDVEFASSEIKNIINEDVDYIYDRFETEDDTIYDVLKATDDDGVISEVFVERATNRIKKIVTTSPDTVDESNNLVESGKTIVTEVDECVYGDIKAPDDADEYESIDDTAFNEAFMTMFANVLMTTNVDASVADDLE